MTHRSQGHHGFSIVELLIVITVIGILATVGILGYNGITQRASDNSVLSDIEAVAILQTNYALATQTSGKEWYSGDGIDPDFNFTPSPGNVIDVVASDREYCVRGYSPRGTMNSLANAFLRGSSTSACNKLLPSESASAASPSINSATVSNFAGSTAGYLDGAASVARFNWPWDMAFGASGSIFLADTENYRIRKITTEGAVTTFAGSGYGGGYTDGVGVSADFIYLQCIGSDASGNLYVCDAGAIRKITPEGVVSTLTVGVQGNGLDVDRAGNVYVAAGHLIQQITPAGVVSTLAGSVSGFADGLGAAARFNSPKDVVVDPQGNVFVADDNNYRIRKISNEGEVTTIAGGSYGFADGTGSAAQFDDIRSIAMDHSRNLYVSDRNRIRKITQEGVVTTVAGSTSAGNINAIGTDARFSSIQGIAFDTRGVMYIADRANNLIRKML